MTKAKCSSAFSAGLAGLFIASLVLVGWIVDARVLKSVIPGYITMKANTAVLFGLLSIALILLSQPSRTRHRVVAGLCGFTILIAGLTLTQYLTGLDFKIDEILFYDYDGASGRFPPGRMAPITAINFILLSLSYFFDRFTNRYVVVTGQILASMVFFASFQGLVGYIIGLTYLFGSAFYTQMAVHTALSFVLLSTGKLFLHPGEGLFQNLHRVNSPTAKMTKWMLATSVIVPPLVQWSALKGFEAGLYDRDFSQLIQAVGITAVLALMAIWVGAILFRTEEEVLRQQRVLQESEEKFRALVDVSAQIVWSADESGDIVEDSPSWRAFTGQTTVEWLGRGWLNAIHPHDQGRAAHAWGEATRMRKAYHVEYRVRHKSGEWRWTHARGAPMFRSDGTIRGWVGMNSDIHERKLIEFDLKSAKDEAERANELKSAFLANMSHEIRTPLGAMIGFNDLLRDESLSNDERARYLDIVSRNGAQLSVLINDILDLSKVEAGHLTFDFLPTNPVDVVREVMTLLESNARFKNVELKYEVLGQPATFVTTDPMRLKQILVNVIGNAIKFTNLGHVTVRVASWSRPDGRPGVSFEVEDTGIGILDSQKNHVFDMFVQADGSLTRRFGGTGLGLSLSRRLARELGGDVFLKQTKAGVGTTFVVQIEDRPETPQYVQTQERRLREGHEKAELRASENNVDAAAKNSFAMDPSSLKGIRILLVDDAPDNRDLITHYLTKLGADVVTAENGLIGSQYGLAGQFDIILMDLQMPIMDGYAATRKLRDNGYTRPIIALTAHAMTEVRQKCLDVGCTDHLPKPINFGVLARKVERFVKISREIRPHVLSKV